MSDSKFDREALENIAESHPPDSVIGKLARALLQSDGDSGKEVTRS